MNTDHLKETLDKAYEHAEEVPWNNLVPPPELVELIKKGTIRPCRSLDIGCGNGHYSIYLAKLGFGVTGIDISEKAIQQAKENALKENVKVNFLELDAREIKKLSGNFDFVFEWGLLHFIMPEFREKYINDLSQKINKGGVYMVLTFNDQSPEWGGGKFRIGLTKAPLYYSSMEELVNLYKPYFEIIETKIRPTLFKNSGNEHLENYLLLRRI